MFLFYLSLILLKQIFYLKFTIFQTTSLKFKNKIILNLFSVFFIIILPATHAFVNEAILPAIIALKARLENTFDLDGANALSPPICIPIEATFANPHNA
jgi:hypothetical protein